MPPSFGLGTRLDFGREERLPARHTPEAGFPGLGLDRAGRMDAGPDVHARSTQRWTALHKGALHRRLPFPQNVRPPPAPEAANIFLSATDDADDDVNTTPDPPQHRHHRRAPSCARTRRRTRLDAARPFATAHDPERRAGVRVRIARAQSRVVPAGLAGPLAERHSALIAIV
jgi:hypothetical protein